jgi:hypothetical protein
MPPPRPTRIGSAVGAPVATRPLEAEWSPSARSAADLGVRDSKRMIEGTCQERAGSERRAQRPGGGPERHRGHGQRRP